MSENVTQGDAIGVMLANGSAEGAKLLADVFARNARDTEWALEQVAASEKARAARLEAENEKLHARIRRMEERIYWLLGHEDY